MTSWKVPKSSISWIRSHEKLNFDLMKFDLLTLSLCQPTFLSFFLFKSTVAFSFAEFFNWKGRLKMESRKRSGKRNKSDRAKVIFRYFQLSSKRRREKVRRLPRTLILFLTFNVDWWDNWNKMMYGIWSTFMQEYLHGEIKMVRHNRPLIYIQIVHIWHWETCGIRVANVLTSLYWVYHF